MTWTVLPIAELPKHRTEWNEANRACGGSLLLDSSFVEATCEHFGSGNEVLGVFRKDGGVQCMGIFAPQSRFVWQTFQSANAPLGCWICVPGAPFEASIRDLMRKLPGPCLLFGLTQQDPDILPRPEASGKLGILDYIQTPRLRIDGSFEDYWQARGKNLRHNIKRQMNRMTREGVAGRMEFVTSGDAMAACVADYADLETRGWKGQHNTAVTLGDRQSAFYTQILRHYAERGQAVVWRYHLGDRLAASNLCIQRDGTLFVLKTAYDESFKGYSPAQLMNYEAFRSIFEEGQTHCVEFYGPVKDWHTKWTEELRTMYHVNCYRSGWMRKLLALAGRHKEALP